MSRKQSAYLNLNTATFDVVDAETRWEHGDWGGCLQCIEFALQQLESAKSKLSK